MEIWKTLDLNPDYSVSTEGRIRNNKTENILTPWWYGDKNKPYLKVQVGTNRWCRYSVHQLVARTWVLRPDTPEKMDVDHLNGIRTDNRAINLQYCSHQENCKRKFTRKN